MRSLGGFLFVPETFLGPYAWRQGTVDRLSHLARLKQRVAPETEITVRADGPGPPVGRL